MRLALAALLAAASLGGASAAVPADLGHDPGSDPVREAHAHALFRQIRCLVCQNESIDDSEAPLAADLRGLVRGQLAAGRTDAEVKRALVDRYGEFVLLRPRFSAGNAALWLVPFGIVAAGLAAFSMRSRRPASVADEPPLSEAERARVSALAAAATVPPPPRPTDTTPAV